MLLLGSCQANSHTKAASQATKHKALYQACPNSNNAVIRELSSKLTLKRNSEFCYNCGNSAVNATGQATEKHAKHVTRQTRNSERSAAELQSLAYKHTGAVQYLQPMLPSVHLHGIGVRVKTSMSIRKQSSRNLSSASRTHSG